MTRLNCRCMLRVIAAFAVAIGIVPGALGAGSGITYHGRLIGPSGRAVTSANVQFRLQVRTPGNENCLLYEELQVKDLSKSDGVFSVTINDGTGTRLDTSGYGLDQVFANRGSFTFAPASCAAGATYAPNASDGRRFQVLFNDGVIEAGQWEPIPAMAINFIPMAIESQQVGGYKKEQLIRVASGVSTAQTELAATDWSELLSLLNGTSSKFVKPTDQVTTLYGASLPAPSDGQSIRWNSTLNSGSGGWENFTAGPAAAVTSVTAGVGLNVGAGPGGSITSTGTLNVDTGTGANQIVKLDGSARLPAVDGSNLTNINASKLNAISISLAALSNGQVLKYNGSAWVNASDNDSLGGMSCVNGQVAYFNGSWTCQTATSAATASTIVSRDVSGNAAVNELTASALRISNGAGSEIALIAPVAFTSWQMRLPATAGSANQVLQTDGSGNTIWASVSSSAAGSTGQIQFNSSNSFAGDANLNWDNSNKRLGVGTGAPAATLDVAGEVRVGTTSAACTAANKGSIRYNSTTNVLEFCNGSGWNLVQAAACTDATPTAFSFANEANATISTQYESNIVQVTGFNCTLPVTLTGGSSGEVRLCADAACASVVQGWTVGPTSVISGQYMQVRQTSDIAGGATVTLQVIAGGTASFWSLSNAGGDCTTGTPAVGTVCADGTVYAGMTPDGSVKMFTTRCDFGQTWDGATCTGSRLVQTWNNGSSNFTSTGRTSNNTGKSNSAALAAMADAGAPYQAASVCENLTMNGYSDWYLPAFNELGILYANRVVIRNFIAGVFWSSTEADASGAGYLDFVTGTAYSSPKTNDFNVRCVRR